MTRCEYDYMRNYYFYVPETEFYSRIAAPRKVMNVRDYDQWEDYDEEYYSEYPRFDW